MLSFVWPIAFSCRHDVIGYRDEKCPYLHSTQLTSNGYDLSDTSHSTSDSYSKVITSYTFWLAKAIAVDTCIARRCTTFTCDKFSLLSEFHSAILYKKFLSWKIFDTNKKLITVYTLSIITLRNHNNSTQIFAC